MTLGALKALHIAYPDRASEGFSVKEIIQAAGRPMNKGAVGMRLSLMAQQGVVGHTVVDRNPHWSLSLSSMSPRQMVYWVLRNGEEKWFSCAGVAAETGLRHGTVYYNLTRLAKDGYVRKVSGRDGVWFFQCKTSLPPERHAGITNRKDGYTKTEGGRKKFRRTTKRG